MISKSATRGSARPENIASAALRMELNNYFSFKCTLFGCNMFKIIHLTASAAHISAYLLARVSPDDVFAVDAI